MLTEIWLNSNHDLWKDTSIHNRNQLRLHTVDQKQGKGGGLALIHKTQDPVKCIKSGHKVSCKFTTWELKIKNTILTIHGIYHPPYSLTNKIANASSQKSSQILFQPISLHIRTMYSLHVSDTLDTDSAIFNDSINAMGLYQHEGFTTHKSGNILDLVLSDITENTKVLITTPCPFVTDHHTVIGILV